MNTTEIKRKIKNIYIELNNLKNGVTWLPYYKYQNKLNHYSSIYKTKSEIDITSNFKTKKDLALTSLCIDKIIEEYLHSKIFHFNNIGVLPNPFRFAPKTAILLIYSNQMTNIEYEVITNNKESSSYKDISSNKNYHRISITGLCDGKNSIHLKMYNANMDLSKERTIHIWMENTNMHEYPITKTEHFTPSAYPQILVTGGGPNPFVFNNNGNIFHFLDIRTSAYGIFPLSNGNFLLPYRYTGVPTYANPHTCLLYEMDFTGRIHRTYHVRKGLHHFACVLPNNNIVSISNSIEGHTEDVIVEIERSTGKILREIYIKDLLGDHLINQVDWAHPNSLEYNTEEDSMLVCLRNIHTVIKFNWTTLHIHWIFSPPELWHETPMKNKLLTPLGDIHYSFQAHAVQEIKDFHKSNSSFRFYIIFDNHRLNRRPLTNHIEDGHSYINIYGINEKTMQVKQFKHMKIDASLVRSNALYDTASNHLFNMSGCRPRTFVDHRGKIEEYDYDTHRLLNCWQIRRDFFSAYPFTWHSDDYCDPISTTDNFQYNCGEGDPLLPVTEPLPEEKESLASNDCFSRPYIEEHYLYFYTTDHSITSLIFQGTMKSYQRDYSNTWQTYKIHRDRKYYCVVSLENLPPDKYSIKVIQNGALYRTDKYIEIQKNSYAQ